MSTDKTVMRKTKKMYGRHIGRIVSLMATLLTAAQVHSATEVTWVGGASGDFSVASNWDPQTVPSDEKKTAYVAVFTNSVALSNSSDYWYPSGVRVAAGAAVVFSGVRCYPSEKCEDGNLVFDIGENASFKFNGTIFYGTSSLTLVKRGAGSFQSTGWCGNSTAAARFYKAFDIQGGTFITSSNDRQMCAAETVTVRNGATLQRGAASSPFNNGSGHHPAPRIIVEQGGRIDLNQGYLTLPNLSGAGDVVNCVANRSLTLNLTTASESFLGTVSGGGTVIVQPVSNLTAQVARWIVGSANTLSNVALSVNAIVGYDADVAFAPGIGTYYVKSVPARAYYDTTGEPVRLRVPSPHIWYVNAQAADGGDGTSPARAFNALCQAMTNAALTAYDTVYVAPGTYSNGVMTLTQASTITTYNRVVIPANVRLIATGTPEETVILGADAPVSPDKCYGDGEGAVRGVYMYKGAELIGFTVTGGRVYSTDPGTPTSGAGLGGGIYADDLNCVIADCIISNNVAVRGGGAQKGTFYRCRFEGNRATQIGAALMDHARVYNCVFSGGLGSYDWYAAGNPSIAVNCTFGSNAGGGIRATGTTDDKRSHFYNCVFLSAPVSTDSTSSTPGPAYHRCLMTADDGSIQNITRDEDCIVTYISSIADRLAFAGLGEDLRPLNMSARVVDAANETYYTNNFPVTDYCEWGKDVQSATRVQNGALDLGAYECDPSVAYVLVTQPESGMTVSGLTPGVSTQVKAGETLTYTLVRTFDSALLCQGFTVNGVYYDFDDYPDGVTRTVYGGDYRRSETVEAVFVTQNAWYVDPKDGHDDACGYHVSRPFKNVETAMAHAASGETVWAAPGWYSNETVVTSATSVQTNRVVVKKGVSFRSRCGAAQTFIVGAVSPETLDEPSARGCGTGAVRCVYLDAGATLAGFTLTNGHTVAKGELTAKGTMSWISGSNGGGVQGPKDEIPCKAVMEDCVIVDCSAVRGGGASGVDCRRCRFVKDWSPYIGAAANSCELSNCLFDGCNVGSYVTLYCYNIRNCTFLASNAPASALHYQSAQDTPSNAVNCVFMCRSRSSDAADTTACLFSDAWTTPSVANRGAGSRMIGKDDFRLDADGRPLKDSPAVDAGSNAWYAVSSLGTLDLDGQSRIYNGRIDIGAYEYDWRGDFAQTLTSSPKFSVLTASANVTTNAAGGVRLTDGDALTARWTNTRVTARAYAVVVSVTGEGTLTCTCGGTTRTVTAADGAVTIDWANALSTNDLAFAFAGSGTAVISKTKCHGTQGLMLLVR